MQVKADGHVAPPGPCLSRGKEESYLEKILKKREEELSRIRLFRVAQMGSANLGKVSPVLACAVAFLCLAAMGGGDDACRWTDAVTLLLTTPLSSCVLLGGLAFEWGRI